MRLVRTAPQEQAWYPAHLPTFGNFG